MAGVIDGKYGTTGEAKPVQLGVFETGLILLVGTDDQVDQNDYGASNGVPLHGSGEMLGFVFMSQGGDILEPAGKLLIFDTAVTVTAGDTAITGTERSNIIGIVDVSASDWQADATAASQYICCQPVAFNHDDTFTYFVWFHEDATSYNDGAQDEENLFVNVIYRLDHRE
jgi:hypothetical protein